MQIEGHDHFDLKLFENFSPAFWESRYSYYNTYSGQTWQGKITQLPTVMSYATTRQWWLIKFSKQQNSTTCINLSISTNRPIFPSHFPKSSKTTTTIPEPQLQQHIRNFAFQHQQTQQQQSGCIFSFYNEHLRYMMIHSWAHTLRPWWMAAGLGVLVVRHTVAAFIYFDWLNPMNDDSYGLIRPKRTPDPL